MAVIRLVIQDRKNEYIKILENSEMDDILSGLYDDDGRAVQRNICYGERFVNENNCFMGKKKIYIKLTMLMKLVKLNILQN